MTLLFLRHADDAQSAEDCCSAIYLSEVAGPHLDGAILRGSEDVMLSNDTSDASAVDLHRHTTHSLTATDHQQTMTPPPTPCLWPSAGNGTINNTPTNTVPLTISWQWHHQQHHHQHRASDHQLAMAPSTPPPPTPCFWSLTWTAGSLTWVCGLFACKGKLGS